MLADLAIGDRIVRKDDGGRMQRLYRKSRSMNNNIINRREFLKTGTTVGLGAIAVGAVLTCCGGSFEGAQSLDRSIIVNSTLEACRDVKIVHFPTQTVVSVSGILAGKTFKLDFMKFRLSMISSKQPISSVQSFQ